MVKIITDASSQIDESNLNKFLGLGGSYSEFHIFTIELNLNNDTGTFKYRLYTANNIVGFETHAGDIGPSHVTNYTAVGDGNITKTGTGTYDLILSGLSKS